MLANQRRGERRRTALGERLRSELRPSRTTASPALVAAAALLWVGISQTGKPKGVFGPPGPTSFGYLTASKACTGP